MSLPPLPSETVLDISRNRNVNILSPDRTPTQGMSPDLTPTHSRLNTPVCSPPLSNAGSGSSTPIQGSAPVNFNTPHRSLYPQSSPIYSPQEQLSYISPQYRQSCTLPNSNNGFNNSIGLRSSLRQASLPRQISSNSIASTNSSNSSGHTCYNNQNSPSIQRKVNFQEPMSPKKTGKKISFNLAPQEVPPLPKKPAPPKRSESTKLTSPKKLVEPPVEFLKDLQRVMRKKWQVRRNLV